MKALREVGLLRIWRFIFASFTNWLVRMALLPPLRKSLISWLGARIGKETVILPVEFINLDRTGLKGLSIGDECYIGAGVMFDLAEKINLGKQVTFGPRVTILTHINVGYKDHPLQKSFPARSEPVTIGDGCFVGAGSLILCGVKIGAGSFIAAGSVVTKGAPPNSVLAGVPAKQIDTADPPP